MTKLTEMNATTRRNVARDHRVKAALLRTQLDAEIGFTTRFATLKVLETFHTTQAKLWEAAATHAEMSGFVRLT